MKSDLIQRARCASANLWVCLSLAATVSALGLISVASAGDIAKNSPMRTVGATRLHLASGPGANLIAETLCAGVEGAVPNRANLLGKPAPGRLLRRL